jgi:hypothetical protein
MKHIYDGIALGAKLAQLGMLPDECVSVRLVIEPDAPLQLEYRKNVTSDDLPKIAQALMALHDRQPPTTEPPGALDARPCDCGMSSDVPEEHAQDCNWRIDVLAGFPTR